MQRKIQNKTLFVAALSVYLGLLIVGAPPQVLAQAALATAQENRIDEKKQTNEILFQGFGAKVKALAAQGKLDSFDITIRAEIRGNSFVNSQQIVAQGDKELAEFLENLAESFFKQLPASNFEWTLKGDKTNIDGKISLKFDSVPRAGTFASLLNHLLNTGRQYDAASGHNLLKEFIVTSENDQVFIITRLPRAALDSLVKADEKAN